MIHVYLDGNIIKDDLTHQGALCSALDRIQKEGLCEMYIVSEDMENDEMRNAFKHGFIHGGFQYMQSLPEITKDVAYISDNSMNLYRWVQLKGKAILASKHPMVEYDFFLPRFSAEQDDAYMIYDKLKRFMHI